MVEYNGALHASKTYCIATNRHTVVAITRHQKLTLYLKSCLIFLKKGA